MNKSKEHLSNRVFVYAVVWVVSYTGSLLALKNLTLEKEAGVLLVAIPVAAFGLFLYKHYRSIFFMDEVLIRVQMEAVVVAFSLGLLTLMTLGLLDLVVVLNKEDWGHRHLLPYFVAFYFIGLFIAKRKYNLIDEKHD